LRTASRAPDLRNCKEQLEIPEQALIDAGYTLKN